MDHGSFDRIARLLGAAGSRRAAVSALLGAGALGGSRAMAAKNTKHRGQGKKGKQGGVSAQAVCAPPGVGVNRNNCDYTGEDFSGDDISSSAYKNTIFRNADLIETNLSSSNMRGANFRGADLTCADLSSSNLRNADFRGFASPGRETNLTLADLSSSACGGLDTNGRTIFCGTIDCNGNVRNDDCPGGPDSDFCCTPCGAGEQCVDRRCFLAFPNCAGCGAGIFGVAANSGGINLCTSARAGQICAGQPCTDTADCPANQWCDITPNCGNRCVPGCRA